MVGKVNVLQQASMAAAAQGSKASCCIRHCCRH